LNGKGERETKKWVEETAGHAPQEERIKKCKRKLGTRENLAKDRRGEAKGSAQQVWQQRKRDRGKGPWFNKSYLLISSTEEKKCSVTVKKKKKPA